MKINKLIGLWMVCMVLMSVCVLGLNDNDFNIRFGELSDTEISNQSDIDFLRDGINGLNEEYLTSAQQDKVNYLQELMRINEEVLTNPELVLHWYREASPEDRTFYNDAFESLQITSNGDFLGELNDIDTALNQYSITMGAIGSGDTATIEGAVESLEILMANYGENLPLEYLQSVENIHGAYETIYQLGTRDVSDLSVEQLNELTTALENLQREGMSLNDAQKKLLDEANERKARQMSSQDVFNRIYDLARLGRYIAQKKGVEAFEWAEEFFQSSFGRFITGEPPAGICQSHIRTSGNSAGIIMDEGGLTPLVAHIEGEKSEVINPETNEVEYFYRITLQVKAESNTERVWYNVDLYNKNMFIASIFRQNQESNGTASLVGRGAIKKYSDKEYDKLCLKSSAGNTCNRFVDITELATVEPTMDLPVPENDDDEEGTSEDESNGNGVSGPTSNTQDPENDW